MKNELHIASFVLQVRPEAIPMVDAAVMNVPIAEISAREGGRMILLVETTDSRELTSFVDSLRDIPGVLNVNLVYHHAEAKDLLTEEISDGHAA